MEIVRAPREKPRYVKVQNSTARDRRLTFKATGLLVHLLSLPDWEKTTVEALAEQAIEGRDAIRKMMTELETYGYVKRIKTRGAAGYWVHKLIVHEVPTTDHPATENTSVGSPAETHESAAQPSDGFSNAGEPVDRREEDLVVEKTCSKTLAPPSATPGDGSLFGASSTKGGQSVEQLAIDSTARRVWDVLDPKPSGKTAFVSLRAVVKALLANWTPDEIVVAAPLAGTISIRSMEIPLRNARKPIATHARSSGNGRLQGEAFDDAVRNFATRNGMFTTTNTGEST